MISQLVFYIYPVLLPKSGSYLLAANASRCHSAALLFKVQHPTETVKVIVISSNWAVVFLSITGRVLELFSHTPWILSLLDSAQTIAGQVP